MVVHLKGVGEVRLFAFPESVKNGGQGKVRYTVCSEIDIKRGEVEKLKKIRWEIEKMFRVLKSVLSADKFFVRVGVAILGFITLAFCGFMLLEKLRVLKGISPYALRNQLRKWSRKALYSNPLFSL